MDLPVEHTDLSESGPAEHDFCLFYQPFYNLSSGRLQGHEALFRKRISDIRVFSAAATLVPLMNAQQLRRLDDWVALTASSRLAYWRDSHALTETILAVNVSVPSLLDAAFVASLTEHLYRLRVPHDRVLFDLQATTLSTNSMWTRELLSSIGRLRAAGFTFCIDGIDGQHEPGMDSEVWATVDIAKLSPELLAAATQDLTGAADVSNMTASQAGAATLDMQRQPEPRSGIDRFDDLCEALHERDLPILVTGVENAEQLALARSRDCEWAQGYLLGEPTFATDTAPGASALTA